MADAIYITFTIGLFLLMFAYVWGCEKLR